MDASNLIPSFNGVVTLTVSAKAENEKSYRR